MESQKKEKWIYLLILVSVAAVAITFVSSMGFLNYRSVAIALEEQVIRRVEEEIVSGMETAIGFGKSFENYYGVDDLFETFRNQYAGPSPFIIDTEGNLLYADSSEGQEGTENAFIGFLSSRNMERALPGLTDLEGPVESGKYRAVFAPIRQDEKVIGYFGALFTESIFAAGFRSLGRGLLTLTLIIFPVVALALFVFVWRVRSRRWTATHRRKSDQNLEHLFSIAILGVGIFVLSGLSLYTYQDDYRDRMENSIRISMHNLETRLEHVRNQGVDLREVENLKQYISDRVSSLEALRTVRIAERISEVRRTDEESGMLSFAFKTTEGSEEAMYLEAELSERAISREMRSIILILTSTTIILLIFVFELNHLVELTAGGTFSRVRPGEFSEKKVSIALRFTGFLCSTAEYMCVPYAAMMIRDSGEALFGLSVGMTAALPLTLEGLTQMLGMFLLPRFVRKFGIRKVLAASTALMIACNMAAFGASGALTIILCRAAAGIAYSGFKQVSNFLITRGYVTEAGRSENISQDNAGLLAGATCGAGLGAILSANAGYPATFLISAVFFALSLAFTFFLVPWKQLSGNQEEAGVKKPIRAGDIFRMLFSPEMLFFILFIGIPLNIGVMLCVTLIPAICQENGISSVMLSYCYIANGLAGIYIGPALVARAKARFGPGPCIAFAFALTAVSIFILRIPPVMLMIVITSMILGFLDGFATPMVTDSFMSLKIVKNAVDESTALIFSVVLSFVLLTFAPMIAELLLLPGKGAFTPMMAGAAVYAAAAVLVLLFRRKANA